MHYFIRISRTEHLFGIQAGAISAKRNGLAYAAFKPAQSAGDVFSHSTGAARLKIQG